MSDARWDCICEYFIGKCAKTNTWIQHVSLCIISNQLLNKISLKITLAIHYKNNYKYEINNRPALMELKQTDMWSVVETFTQFQTTNLLK